MLCNGVCTNLLNTFDVFNGLNNGVDFVPWAHAIWFWFSQKCFGLVGRCYTSRADVWTWWNWNKRFRFQSPSCHIIFTYNTLQIIAFFNYIQTLVCWWPRRHELDHCQRPSLKWKFAAWTSTKITDIFFETQNSKSYIMYVTIVYDFANLYQKNVDMALAPDSEMYILYVCHMYVW